MSQNFAQRYPGRWGAATTANPLGVAKNRTSETSQDGSYLEKDIFQTIANIVAGVLGAMDDTANNNVDVVGDSQFMRNLNALISGGADLYIDSGTPNTYVLTPKYGEGCELFDGMQVRFKPISTSTDVSTVNVNGSGAKSIVTRNGNPLSSQNIESGRDVKITYDEGNDRWYLSSFDHIDGVGSCVLGFDNTAPYERCLLADGAAISRTTYAALFEAIGTIYGSGDGSTTFNLPDARGEFIRVLDNGRGVDNGRTIGSAQGQAIQAHTHNYTASTTSVGTDTGTAQTVADDVFSPTATSSTGGTETRPRNIALSAWIRY